ncbi:galactokinase [Jeotgalibaca dankookensis]|uniref:galactokinase n=1 Tax=Jeotgalibaca dankookensis TaxID=708126 RepID=UPI00157B0DC3
MNLDHLYQTFKDIFFLEATDTFFSPGRINLIGEHTDYNGGHVFPATITLGTYALVAKNGNQTLRLFSTNFPETGILVVDLDDLEYRKEDSWGNYVKGMAKYLKEAGYKLDVGLDILIEGNIPNASGLSSSASLELLAGIIFEKMAGLDIERLELVKLGKKVENDYFGLNSGIMDQFAIGMGEKDHALMLDTNTLEYEKIPVELGDRVIVIMNTKKRRELVDSKYNERLSECQQALKELQTELDIESLGELDEATFEAHTDLLSNETLVRRARHAVTENQRTLVAAEKLKAGELEAFGKLMNASHVSLRDDYEVSGVELDTLVEKAWQEDGVLGARMTGAGFGGCAIAIVDKDKTDDFIQSVGDHYQEVIGYPAEFYIAEIGNGARAL